MCAVDKHNQSAGTSAGPHGCRKAEVVGTLTGPPSAHILSVRAAPLRPSVGLTP
jgi:hypothetical protein